MAATTSQSTPQAPAALSIEEREAVSRQVGQACQSVAQLWPLKTFAYRNPIRGYEHLPFDEAVREGRRLQGGVGYLPNHEYRQFYRDGRITEKNVRRALDRFGPSADSEAAVQVGSRRIDSSDVFLQHLLSGIEALEPALLDWTLKEQGLGNPLREDPPAGGNGNGRAADLWDSAWSLLYRQEPLNRGQHASGEDAPRGEAAQTGAAADAALPDGRTIGDWLDLLAGASIVERIDAQMIKWTAAFLDEGLAGWGMPSRNRGFYQSWRELAARDFSCRFLGVKNFAGKVRSLPDAPEEAIALCLHRLELPPERWKDYQSRHFAQLPGWTGFVRWRSETPEYPAQHEHPVDLVQYLAVRLFYEVELVNAFCEREWSIPGTLSAITSWCRSNPDRPAESAEQDSHNADGRKLALCRDAWRLFRLARSLELTPGDVRALSLPDARTLLAWLDAFPEDDHGAVWLEAYEDAFREDFVGKLSAHGGSGQETDGRPRAQLIFCIDARSEPFRRHLESQGPYETFGYAGFFGVPMSHQAFDSTDRLALCPVLLKPGHAVAESPRSGEQGPLQAYASGTRWRRLGDELFHDLKQNPISSFMLIDALGLLFSIGLIGKTLLQKPFVGARNWVRRKYSHTLKTRIPFSRSEPGPGSHPTAESQLGLLQGFTLEEQARFVEGGLRIIGLTRRFGRLVIACGHGAISENNPYAAAYNCGACGGSHGDPNARVFAAMANHPDIRSTLRRNGLVIPEDTWFLAGKHDTTTDRVEFYDVVDLPSNHAEDLRALSRDLDEAGARQTLERCGRLPRAPKRMSPKRAYAHALSRSTDWANVRPEWGLSSNAAFIIGRRRMTAGLDLSARAFLHSYDPDSDPDGALLEKIMTAPLIVGEWINMEYYFSAVDPWFYGSGSKVIHNVVSGVGVMLGSQSDLQSGLPLQGVNDGAVHYHEPMRLLAIIEAPKQRIASIIRKHDVLQQIFHNRWMNLLALDPQTRQFHRYHPDSTWEAMTLSRAA